MLTVYALDLDIDPNLLMRLCSLLDDEESFLHDRYVCHDLKILFAEPRPAHETLNALSQIVSELSKQNDRQKLEGATCKLDQALMSTTTWNQKFAMPIRVTPGSRPTPASPAPSYSP